MIGCALDIVTVHVSDTCSGVHPGGVDVQQKEEMVVKNSRPSRKRRQSMGFVSLQELGWKMARIKCVRELNNSWVYWLELSVSLTHSPTQVPIYAMTISF